MTKTTIKRTLYIFAALTVVAWSGHFTIKYWHTKITETTAYNHAALTELNGHISSLKLLNNTSQTKHIDVSSNLENYRVITKLLKEVSLRKESYLKHGLSAKKISELNDEANANTQMAEAELSQLIERVTLVSKFLQYSPENDLEPLASELETGNSERNTRTTKGIRTIVQKLRANHDSTSKKLISSINPLINESERLSPDTLEQWYISVNKAQREILSILNEDLTDWLNSTTEKMAMVSQRFLDLR